MSLTHLDGGATEESTFKQVSLELWHPGCWTTRVTERYPDTHIIEKSLYPAADVIKGDFIFVSKGDGVMTAFIEAISECEVVDDVAVLKRSAERARAVVIYRRESSILPPIVNSDFMPIEPVHITGGQEFWTVLVRESAMSDIVDRMETEYDVDIRAIQSVDPSDDLEFADVVDRIHDDLSNRQRECLFEAREAGYYSWPRDLSAKAVADDVGLSGPTFLEHLRKGEQKILHATLEELQRRHTRH